MQTQGPGVVDVQLFRAASLGCLADLHEALRSGANPNSRHADGLTPLMEAARSKASHCIEPLIEAGAFIDAVDIDGYFPLYYSCIRSHSKGVEILLRLGADPNAQQKFQRNDAPLHLAASFGDIESCRLLLAHGADPNIENDASNTPLLFAARGGHLDCLWALLAAGAQPDAPNARGETPLQASLSAQQAEAALSLIQAGADVSRANHEGLAPCSICAAYGFARGLEILLASGVDPDSERSTQGLSPIEIAQLEGHDDCVAMLLAKAEANELSSAVPTQSTSSHSHRI